VQPGSAERRHPSVGLASPVNVRWTAHSRKGLPRTAPAHQAAWRAPQKKSSSPAWAAPLPHS